MSKEEIFKTLNNYKKQIESKGLVVYAIMLKGSQNYNLDDEESDIDADVILIPQLHEIDKARCTHKFTFDNGEVVCHDIYSFCEIVAKGNPQWIEVCHTEYKIGGDLSFLKDYKINPSALKGMAYEKVKAFDHLFPSREHIVKKFGYDPKQLHHIIRLYDLLLNDVAIYKYNDKDREEMIAIKRGLYDIDKANEVKNEYMQKIVDLAEVRKLEYKTQPIDYTLLNKIVIESNLGRKIITNRNKMIYQTCGQLRTFDNDIPSFISKYLSKDIKEIIKNKDVNINIYIEVEEL